MPIAMPRQDLTPRQPSLPKQQGKSVRSGAAIRVWHARMIDIFTVVLPHVLMAIAIWRLLHRDDLDHDQGYVKPGFRDSAPRGKPAAPPRGEGTPGA